jgi:hypothetical protein
VGEQPGEQGHGDGVGVAGVVGEDEVEGVGVFEGQAGGGSAADAALVDEYGGTAEFGKNRTLS